MNNRPTWLEVIETSAGGKAVLLVEGETDIKTFGYFLARLFPDWNTRFVMHSANSKEHVIAAIEKYHSTDWVGVVDRDEWSPSDIIEKTQNLPRIKVLPRFCLENYFCVPSELWDAFPSHQKSKQPFEALKEPIEKSLPAWLSHAAIWRAIHKRHSILVYGSDFPSELENCPIIDTQGIPDEQRIRQILEAWHNQLDPNSILAEYRQELAGATQLNPEQQLSTYIHGKKFFNEVVVKTLNTLFGQQPSVQWRENFTTLPAGIAIPTDLQAFLTEIVSLF